jgi:hypothetical protein
MGICIELEARAIWVAARRRMSHRKLKSCRLDRCRRGAYSRKVFGREIYDFTHSLHLAATSMGICIELEARAIWVAARRRMSHRKLKCCRLDRCRRGAYSRKVFGREIYDFTHSLHLAATSMGICIELEARAIWVAARRRMSHRKLKCCRLDRCRRGAYSRKVFGREIYDFTHSLHLAATSMGICIELEARAIWVAARRRMSHRKLKCCRLDRCRRGAYSRKVFGREIYDFTHSLHLAATSMGICIELEARAIWVAARRRMSHRKRKWCRLDRCRRGAYSRKVFGREIYDFTHSLHLAAISMGICIELEARAIWVAARRRMSHRKLKSCRLDRCRRGAYSRKVFGREIYDFTHSLHLAATSMGICIELEARAIWVAARRRMSHRKRKWCRLDRCRRGAYIRKVFGREIFAFTHSLHLAAISMGICIELEARAIWVAARRRMSHRKLKWLSAG